MSTERAVLVAQLAKEFVADRLVSSYYALPMAERILNLPTVARLLRAEESEGERLIRDMADHHAGRWSDQPDGYWLQRLMQEVGELASVLAGDHDDTVEHELAQIGSIALNWLRHRALASLPAPEPREAPDAWLRDSRLRGRVAREVACAAGLRPDDPPLREHLDAAREIIRLVRAAPAALQGEQLHHPRSVAHEYDGDANHEVLSYLEAKLQIAEDANIGRVTVEVDNLRDMIAALRSTEPGGERVPRPKNS